MSASRVYQQSWREWAGWCARQGLPNNAISAPKLANFLLHLFQVGLAWHTIGVYHSAISAFLEPHRIHKASNHPVISKLMHHFYLQCPPSCKQFDPWDVECLLSLLESWAPASSLTTFKLAWITQVIFPPQICIESHSNVNLCLVFYLKAYLRHTESFRKKPDGSRVTSLFFG